MKKKLIFGVRCSTCKTAELVDVTRGEVYVGDCPKEPAVILREMAAYRRKDAESLVKFYQAHVVRRHTVEPSIDEIEIMADA